MSKSVSSYFHTFSDLHLADSPQIRKLLRIVIRETESSAVFSCILSLPASLVVMATGSKWLQPVGKMRLTGETHSTDEAEHAYVHFNCIKVSNYRQPAVRHSHRYCHVVMLRDAT